MEHFFWQKDKFAKIKLTRMLLTTGKTKVLFIFGYICSLSKQYEHSPTRL